jgi:hypothetical protein
MLSHSLRRLLDVDLLAIGHLGLLALTPDGEGGDAANDLPLRLGELLRSAEIAGDQGHQIFEATRHRAALVDVIESDNGAARGGIADTAASHHLRCC